MICAKFATSAFGVGVILMCLRQACLAFSTGVADDGLLQRVSRGCSDSGHLIWRDCSMNMALLQVPSGLPCSCSQEACDCS